MTQFFSATLLKVKKLKSVPKFCTRGLFLADPVRLDVMHV